MTNALRVIKLYESHAPPQLLADYAMKVGQGGKGAEVGTKRTLATWPVNLASRVLPGSLDVHTRCVSNG